MAGRTNLKTLKLKLYPSKDQQSVLRKWFNSSRETYNNTVAYVKEHGIASFMSLRNELVTATRYYCSKCEKYTGRSASGLCRATITTTVNDIETKAPCGTKLTIIKNGDVDTEVPKHVRLAACKSFHTAYKAAVTNIKRGNITHFKLDFKRKKRMVTDSIELEGFNIKHNRLNTYYGMSIPFAKIGKTLKSKTLKTIRKLPQSLKHNVKIAYNFKSREYFLHIPIDIDLPKLRRDNDKILAIDPGVKTFSTIFESTTGYCYKYENRLKDIAKVKERIGKLQSLSKPIPYKYHQKINNIITDTHWRIANDMLKLEPGVIILPNFESQKIKKNYRSRFNDILINSNKHYQFKERLKWMCAKNGVYLLETTEEYTSKTCGICGTINDNLTLSDRVFKCIKPDCANQGTDRDYHAARNILIKTICS